MLNKLAQELNTALHNTVAGRMLSNLGQRLYFPKGIIAQSAEAKKLGKTANGTIGMAVRNGQPLILSNAQRELPNLTPSQAVAYAPTAGDEELRLFWKNHMITKNPSLTHISFSLPVVVPGLTAGLSYLADLFLGKGDVLLTGDPAWDNYALIVETRRNALLTQFGLFTDNGFNIDAFRTAVEIQTKTGKVRVLLNFPQNPSGYSLTVSEAVQVKAVLLNAAEKGADVMVWCDDAYFGLNFEDNIAKESIFAALADLHENIFAVKIDGPTKEDFVWGFRVGFLTFAGKGLTNVHYEALIKKLMGAIRSSVSCASSPSQAILLKTHEDHSVDGEKAEFYQLLLQRYKTVRAFVDSHKDHSVLKPLPFNSGYFMCLACNGINAEELRLKLLNENGIGTISIDDRHLRVAFSSIDTEKLDSVYAAIYKAAEELKQRAGT